MSNTNLYQNIYQRRAVKSKLQRVIEEPVLEQLFQIAVNNRDKLPTEFEISNVQTSEILLRRLLKDLGIEVAEIEVTQSNNKKYSYSIKLKEEE